VAELEQVFLSEDERDWSDLHSDELLAAARSIGPLPTSILVPVLQAIRESPQVDADLLNSFSSAAVKVLKDHLDAPLHEQGYALANWLRSEPNVFSNVGRVNPSILLQDWGIPVLERGLALADLDAIGCWGPKVWPSDRPKYRWVS
jgi:hypothetical protein